MKESFLHIYHASSALKQAIENICVCFRQTNTVDVWEISILYFIGYFIVFFKYKFCYDEPDIVIIVCGMSNPSNDLF